MSTIARDDLAHSAREWLCKVVDHSTDLPEPCRCIYAPEPEPPPPDPWPLHSWRWHQLWLPGFERYALRCREADA